MFTSQGVTKIYYDIKGLCSQFKIAPKRNNPAIFNLYVKKYLRRLHTTTMVNIDKHRGI